MPLGIVSDEEFLSELNSNGKDIPATIGRPTGRTEVPEIIREIASEAAIAGESPTDISNSLGISKSSIAAYKHDATSTASYNKPASHLQRANSKIREKISGKARKNLLAALDVITPGKLEAAKLRDVASVAKDMSAIMRDMEPPSAHNNGIHAQFIFHVPRQKSESEFDVIEVTS